MLHRVLIVCVITTIMYVAAAAAGAAPSVADLVEFRVPAPPPVGERELETGFEIASPTGWPTVLEAADGRLMMIGGGTACYSGDGGRTWSGRRTLSAPVRHAVRLQSGKLAGLEGSKFYLSDDDGKTWEHFRTIDAVVLPRGSVTATVPPVRGSGAFARFEFPEPVQINAGETVWMVLAKEDEPGENPLYSVPESAKDAAGEPRDWYPAGNAAARGPYKDSANPAAWRVSSRCDAYFRICAKIEQAGL